MVQQLKISAGQFSDRGRKPLNQDFHGLYIPRGPQLSSKGIAVALADGISSSGVSHIASEAAVTSFLGDYFCTSDAWSVKRSAQCVLSATSSWLYAQTQQSQYRYDKDRGYVCTLSALVLKATTAHIFHVGDSRVYRLRGKTLEQLTNDHRYWVSRDKSYLSRALGINPHLEIDYQQVQVEPNDIFILSTDGVYEYVSEAVVIDTVDRHWNDLDTAAKLIVAEAYECGSDDNLTLQIVRVDQLPEEKVPEVRHALSELPLPPILEPRMRFDGFKIVRELHGSNRSHIYLAVDEETGTTVALKTPSIDLQHDAAYLERFMMEEWIARRINSPHVLKPYLLTRKRHYLYLVTEYIEGQTLAQWMLDNPRPDLEAVRHIVEQIAKGLQAFHRLEMLHQDLRPNNIMLDKTGTVKIIDFGSTRVAGIVEMSSPTRHLDLLGTAPYTAPEYFLGHAGTTRSDLYSLATTTYQMLTGVLPYGTRVAASRTRAAQNRLKYRSMLDDEREIPVWIDGALRKALQPDPYRRYGELSEFIYDLRHPNKAFTDASQRPLMERNPVRFWQSVSFILALATATLLVLQMR